MPVIIAIDGPAAAGKGTLARRIAASYGLPYLDTGLLYRATARRLLLAGADPADAAAATAIAQSLKDADLQRTDLRAPDVDRAAAAVASIPGVRAALLAFQRSYGNASGAVLDGRDIGTVIFPDATVKLFVTASVAARAERRFKEMLGRGQPADLAAVTADLELRDQADRERAAAPLKPAEDAILLDTSTLDADAAFTEACRILTSRGITPAR